MGFWRHVAANFYKWFVVLVAFFIVLATLLLFRFWGADFTEISFKTGDWVTIILVTVIVTAISMTLIKLLQFEVRTQTRPRRRRRR